MRLQDRRSFKIKHVHPSSNPRNGTGCSSPPPPRSVQKSRKPKLERSQIDIGISLEQWNIFTRRWRVYTKGSGAIDSSALTQLFSCASRELCNSLLTSNAEVLTRSLVDLLAFMRKLISTATSVRRTDLIQMRQMRDEPFRSFGARMRGKANTYNLIMMLFRARDNNM